MEKKKKEKIRQTIAQLQELKIALESAKAQTGELSHEKIRFQSNTVC